MAKDSDLKYLSQEYYDGTLMYEICKDQIWDKAKADEAGLEAFFNNNKKNYTWDAPRFCGVIVHAKDDATLAAAKKAVKGVPETEWSKTLTSTFNNDTVKLVRVERGIHKKGDNANVDKLMFKTGELKPTKGFESTGVIGKVYKKPRTYRDVRGQVLTDYQTQLEVEWLQGLRNKYKVEVNDAVVETVNAH
jgi:peptidyl-prolyl cis-trans isomerase SurA